MASQKKLVRGSLFSSSMRALGVGIGSAPYKIVGQMIANSLDARATRIEITIGERGEFLQCEDNGTGMREEAWSAFIGMGNQSKMGDASTIGENGTGHTAYWMAYERVDVWTAWAENPNCYHLSYSFDEAWEFSQLGGEGGIEQIAVLKSSSGARVKSTGTVIRLTNPWKNDSAVRMHAGDVLRNIARVLSPWQLDMVTVNGQKPKIDFPKGEFYRAVDEVPGMGQIELIAGFADDQVKDHDRSFGTWGAHVCSLSELQDTAPRELANVFAPELSHPNVWFMVRVPSWKHFEGKHTRSFFKPSLFQDKSFEEMVRYLHRVLLPEIRKRSRIDLDQEGVGEEVINRVVSFLAKTVGDPVMTGPALPPKPKQALAFKPARVQLVCGASFVFEVLNAEGLYELNASAAGGSVLMEDGVTSAKAFTRLTNPTQITYRAGQAYGHRYRMVLTRVVAKGEPVESAACEIRLEESLPFRISPVELVLEPGEIGRVSIVNDDDKNGLAWTTTEKGRITPSSDGRSAVVMAPMETGNYTLTCTASDGAQATGRLSVRTVQSRPSDGHGSIVLMKTVLVEGVTFVVMTQAPGEGAQRDKLSLRVRHSEEREFIWFNLRAPESLAAARAKGDALDMLVCHEIITRVAFALVERDMKKNAQVGPIMASDVIQKRDALMARVHGPKA